MNDTSKYQHNQPTVKVAPVNQTVPEPATDITQPKGRGFSTSTEAENVTVRFFPHDSPHQGTQGSTA